MGSRANEQPEVNLRQSKASLNVLNCSRSFTSHYYCPPYLHKICKHATTNITLPSVSWETPDVLQRSSASSPFVLVPEVGREATVSRQLSSDSSHQSQDRELINGWSVTQTGAKSLGQQWLSGMQRAATHSLKTTDWPQSVLQIQTPHRIR